MADRPEGQGWGVPAPSGWSAYPPPAPIHPAERFRLAWHRRLDTDYIFSFWSALGWTILTLGIFGFYVFYLLVRRLRDHNARRLELLDAALAVAWEAAGRQGVQDELTPSFQRAAWHLGFLRRLTTEFRDPAIWLIIAIFARGLAEIVGFVLLDQDLVTHDQAEVGVEQELSIIYGRLGSSLPPPDPRRVKGRDNYVGRILASIFTLGIYALWWYANQMNEPNRHFLDNWRQEDALAVAVQRLAL